MAWINFDCPECGHNLEVDEGGAGFIVKCPECNNPLQVPELPRSRRIRKIMAATSTLLAILFLFAINVYFWTQNRELHRQLTEWKPIGEALQKAQDQTKTQDEKIEELKTELSAIQMPDITAIENAALAAIEKAESLSREIEGLSRKLLESSPSERNALLRADMSKRVEAAKNSLPSAPVITDVGPGRGIQGRQIVFPILPGPDGQTLRENAEVTGIADDTVSVKFAGGTASYLLTELHPGVAAFLPVDPLLSLPRKQWNSEVVRVQQTLNAQRDEQIMQLRADIQAHIVEQVP